MESIHQQSEFICLQIRFKPSSMPISHSTNKIESIDILFEIFSMSIFIVSVVYRIRVYDMVIAAVAVAAANVAAITAIIRVKIYLQKIWVERRIHMCVLLYCLTKSIG